MCRNVGLDQRSHHIGARPLGRKDQMDTGRAGLLGETRDEDFDLAAGADQNQISELIHHNHDIRPGFQLFHLIRIGSRRH